MHFGWRERPLAGNLLDLLELLSLGNTTQNLNIPELLFQPVLLAFSAFHF